VTEFRVAPNTDSSRGEDRPIRLVLWGAVLLLAAIAVFSLIDARSVSALVDTALALGAAVIVMAVVGGAYFLSWRNGVERTKRKAVFLLTEKELIVQRVGWPDVQIGMSEIKALYEQPGRLVVESVAPGRFIAVPTDIKGYGNLRAELVKYGQISKAPRRSAQAFVYIVVCLLCWFSWSLVLLSRNVDVVRAAGAFVLFSSAWFSFRIARLVRRSPKRHLVWTVLAASLAGALWVLYRRMF
jgi:hypothetical protein